MTDETDCPAAERRYPEEAIAAFKSLPETPEQREKRCAREEVERCLLYAEDPATQRRLLGILGPENDCL